MSALFSAPALDRLERIRKLFAMATWHAGMDDPPLLAMLDKEGVERDQGFRQGERIPAPVDLDLDGRYPLALIRGRPRFGDAAHRRISAAIKHCFVHVRLLYSLALSVPSVRRFWYAVIAPSIASGDLICVAAARHECSGGAEHRAVTGCVRPCEEAARLEATASAARPESPAQAVMGFGRRTPAGAWARPGAV
jgi:hypothetical protein